MEKNWTIYKKQWKVPEILNQLVSVLLLNGSYLIS